MLVSGSSGVFWFDDDEWTRDEIGFHAHHFFGFSDRNVYAAANDILHYDGAQWHHETGGFFRGVWGVDDNQMYAVGLGGAIAARQNGEWVAMQSPTTWHLADIWGSSAKHVFAVGQMGRIVQFDGEEWSVVESGVEVDLNAIWGKSSHDIYAVGFRGTATHYDGMTWSPVDLSTDDHLFAITGNTEAMYVVGTNGTILELRDGKWSSMESGTETWLYGLATRPPSEDVLVVGDEGVILNLRGGSWLPMFSGLERTYAGVAGASDGSVCAVGTDYSGGMLRNRNGNGEWSETDWPVGVIDVSIYDRDHAFAAPFVGDYVLRYNGGTWEKLPFTQQSYFTNISGSDADGLFVAHDDTLISFFDGVDWRTGEVPLTQGRVADIVALASGSVLAVGYQGDVLHWGDGEWQLLGELEHGTSITGIETSDVWVTLGHQIWHYDGINWTWDEPELLNNWLDIVSIGAYEAYAVSYEGRVVHIDRDGWKIEESPPVAEFTGITVTGDHLYAVGTMGALVVRTLDR